MTEPCPFCKTGLNDGSRFCHMCGVPLTGAVPQSLCSRTGKYYRWLILISLFLCFVGWFGCFFDAEFGALLGFVNASLGLVLVFMGIINRNPWVVGIGLAHCSLFLICTGLVTQLNWSPTKARVPFILIGAGYLAFIAPLSIYVFRRLPVAQTISPWVCQKCGYLLRGLTEPRCPECGTEFEMPSVSSDSDNG